MSPCVCALRDPAISGLAGRNKTQLRVTQETLSAEERSSSRWEISATALDHLGKARGPAKNSGACNITPRRGECATRRTTRHTQPEGPADEEQKRRTATGSGQELP